MDKHLRNNSLAGYQIGECDERAFDEPLHNLVAYLLSVGPIAGHLRRTGQGTFERGGTGGDESCGGMLHQRRGDA